MESAYETTLGYWRKANTAIRECFFHATEPKATSAKSATAGVGATG